MAWSTPVTQTTGTHITAAVWNAQITNNAAYLGNTHAHDGAAGGGSIYGLLPQGIILMADAACPTGWTRVSAFDGLFVRGAATYGGTGGGGTHTHSHSHAGLLHVHDQNFGDQDQIIDATKIIAATAFSSAGMSQGTAGGSTAYQMASGFLDTTPGGGSDATTGTDLPAYISVIFCKKD
jgi:hypothetical protein